LIAEVDAVWVEKGDLSAFTMPFLSKVVEQMLYKQPTNNLTLHVGDGDNGWEREEPCREMPIN